MFEETPLRGLYELRPMTFWELALYALRRRGLFLVPSSKRVNKRS